jgi:hypothetical protein
MYWARRDALARITAMCLWQGPGCQNSVCDECSLLFHEIISTNGSEVKEEILVGLAMTGTQLVPTLPVPSEKALVGLWKAAALYSSKFPQKAGIGSKQSVPIKVNYFKQHSSSSRFILLLHQSFPPCCCSSNIRKFIPTCVASKLRTFFHLDDLNVVYHSR